MKTWLCQDPLFLSQKKSEWIEEMSSCETIFNLANTMMGSGWGANVVRHELDTWDPLKKHPQPEFFSVFTGFFEQNNSCFEGVKTKLPNNSSRPIYSLDMFIIVDFLTYRDI